MGRRSMRMLAVAASTALVIAALATGGMFRGSALRAPVAYKMASEKALLSATSDPSPPTSTPNSPGIVIASSNQLDLPDPFLLAAQGQYFMYMSTAFFDPTRSNIPMLVGGPGHWGPVSEALPVLPSWAVPASEGGFVWDPYVVYLDGRYLMYFSPQLRSDPIKTNEPMHCLAVATSSSPQGPFVPVPGPPLLCQTSLGGDIDVEQISDPNEPWAPGETNYLVWKSDDNNLPGSGPTTIWAARLTNDGLSVVGSYVAIFRGDEPWEEPVLEAPQMVKSPDGTDWLFFSAGIGYFSSDYAMGAAECNGPLGGCHSVISKPLIASNAQGAGPGEETVFEASDSSMWILYNPWFAASPFAPLRPAEAARIGWGADGPYIAEAGTFPLVPSEIGLQLFTG
jgi:hypothetical protein